MQKEQRFVKIKQLHGEFKKQTKGIINKNIGISFEKKLRTNVMENNTYIQK